MSKNKDQKRKAQLAVRAKNESFRFQVEYTKKQKGIDIIGMEHTDYPSFLEKRRKMMAKKIQNYYNNL